MRPHYKKALSVLFVFFMILQYMPSAYAGPASGQTSTEESPSDAPTVTSDVYGDPSQPMGITMSGADPWNAAGTADDPYVITTADQLNEVRQYSGGYFELGNDIDLNVPPYNTGEGWEPILWFNGTFDGKGFEISGLYINRPVEDEVGLFGSIGDGAEIADVHLVHADVTGNYVVGGLAGWNRGSIRDSSVSGKVTGEEAIYESDTVGGMIGYNEGEVSRSHANAEVTGHYLVGGLTGDNSGNILDSYASGNVIGAENVGGLVGWNFSGTAIVNSHASGDVTGNAEVGGLVGTNSGGISYSYASGEVNGNSKVGGLAGSNSNVVDNAYASGQVSGVDKVGGLVGENSGGIQSSYASGAVTGNSETGGLVGFSTGTGNVQNSYWDTEASGQSYSAGGEGKTTAQLQKQDTYADNWDLFTVWLVDEGAGYPHLRWELNLAAPPPWQGEGNGTENEPFRIVSAEQFYDVRHYLNAHFELDGDIDLGQDYGAGDGWEPIGTTSDPFIGTLDGKGYKITGLYINHSSENEVGLFGATGSESEISNIRLENIRVTGNRYVGGLVGMNGGAIHHVYVSGEVTGSHFVGGLAGAHSGTINQSHASGKVDGDHFVGGLAGVNEGSITDSYARGEVIATTSFAGGLVGSNDGGAISNAYASGKVTGETFSGGLVSGNESGTVTASYWDQETTNQAASAGSSDEYGKSAAEMKQQATFAGWDFERVWAIDEGESYPYLRADYAGAGTPWTGSGTAEDPYVVRTAAHFDQIRDHLNAHFKLGADINLDVLPYNTGEGWEPIDWFNGKLDGKGYKISGLYINRSKEDVVGLFGHADDASELSNLKLEDISVTAADYDLVGGLVGYNYGSISYSSVSGKVEAKSNAGGLVGYNDGSVRYSAASGEVTGSDFLGGLVGANAGVIQQSYASNKVNGTDFLGGLVGVSDGSIRDSYATGNVTASNSYAGGLVGANDGNISHSYATGKVEISSGYVGGLVSEVDGGKINYSYWDVETTNQSASAGSKHSSGKSTAEMKQQATFEGWDFDGIWEIEENEGYPVLKWVTNAKLSGLALSAGTLSPVFTAETLSYRASVRSSVNSVNLTATAASGGASLIVNGTSVISGVATAVPLQAGRNTIEVAVTAYDGVSTKWYTIEVTRQSEDSSSSDEPNAEVINVSVETGQIGAATKVMQTPITRITEPDGRVRDEVRLTPDQARETAQRIAEAGQTTARIVIPDEEDKVSQVEVSLLKEAVSEWADHKVNLEIFTENIRLLIPQTSMAAFEEDVYFRVIPLKEEAQRQEVEDRAKSEQVVQEAAKDGKVKVVSRPMTIETNMPRQPVTLVLPLRDVQLPSDEAERTKLLQELMIFIEHSDGERRLLQGRIVEYKDGLFGIEFEVNKLSTFTILHMENRTVQFHQAYIQGYEDGTFKPDRNLTRAEIAAMIARNQGFDGSALATAAPFSDVPVSHWAAGAIAYVKQQGYMAGDAAGAFRPNAVITRAEMAAIAARYKQLRLGTEQQSITAFADIAGHWAVLEIAANKQAGILSGYEDGTFRPNGHLTRAEGVTVINRLLDRGPLYEAGKPTFLDVVETHWAFEEIEEAARDHSVTPGMEGGEYRIK